jgi:tRNA pseudouridine55 synthase
MFKREEFALLPVYKPKGLTSTEVLNRLKRKFGIKKLGHTGTLDPFAEGVLPVLLGRATRLAEYYQRLPKIYEAVGLLGMDTDTYDITGKVVKDEVPPSAEREKIEEVLKSFEGEIEQIPPPFSAKKVGGKRAYRLARSGKKVELKPVKVKIYSLKLLEYLPPRFKIEATVSGGTYIRSLVRDIGLKLGSVATTESLVRTAVGPITAQNCFSLEGILNSESLDRFLLPPEEGLKNFPSLELPPRELKLLTSGVKLQKPSLKDGLYRVYDERGNFVAVASAVEGKLKPDKVFLTIK